MLQLPYPAEGRRTGQVLGYTLFASLKQKKKYIRHYSQEKKGQTPLQKQYAPFQMLKTLKKNKVSFVSKEEGAARRRGGLPAAGLDGSKRRQSSLTESWSVTRSSHLAGII